MAQKIAILLKLNRVLDTTHQKRDRETGKPFATVYFTLYPSFLYFLDWSRIVAYLVPQDDYRNISVSCKVAISEQSCMGPTSGQSCRMPSSEPSYKGITTTSVPTTPHMPTSRRTQLVQQVDITFQCSQRARRAGLGYGRGWPRP